MKSDDGDDDDEVEDDDGSRFALFLVRGFILFCSVSVLFSTKDFTFKLDSDQHFSNFAASASHHGHHHSHSHYYVSKSAPLTCQYTRSHAPL